MGIIPPFIPSSNSASFLSFTLKSLQIDAVRLINILFSFFFLIFKLSLFLT